MTSRHGANIHSPYGRAPLVPSLNVVVLPTFVIVSTFSPYGLLRVPLGFSKSLDFSACGPREQGKSLLLRLERSLWGVDYIKFLVSDR